MGPPVASGRALILPSSGDTLRSSAKVGSAARMFHRCRVIAKKTQPMASLEELAAALRTLATPGMTPKAPRTAIRETLPEVTKKEVNRAGDQVVVPLPDGASVLLAHASTTEV